MMRSESTPHPDDDALLMFVDDSAVESDVRVHLMDCRVCETRLAELVATRSLLQAAANRNQRSPHELAEHALSRLRMRHTSIEDVNELLTSLRALIVGLAELFVGLGPPSGTSRVTHANSDEGSSRG